MLCLGGPKNHCEYWPLFSECVATKAGVHLTARCTFAVEAALASMPAASVDQKNHMLRVIKGCPAATGRE